jgi:rhodanese-related sulfurtransferase
MTDKDLRITAEELKTRMAAGEEFTILDGRNPQAWAQASDMARGAMRVEAHAPEQTLPRIPRTKPVIAYCT